MNKEEQVEELLSKHTENVSVNHWVNAIHEDKIEDLAKEVTKLFDTPREFLIDFIEVYASKIDMYDEDLVDWYLRTKDD